MTGERAAGMVATPTGTTAAVAAGAVAVLTVSLSGGPAGIPVTVLGLAGLLYGLRGGRSELLDGGALVLFAGVTVSGATGGRTFLVVVGAAAAVVAWDAASDAIVRGEQLGSGAGGVVEARRLAATASVVGVGGLVGIASTTVVTTPVPPAVLGLLIAGAVLLLVALRQ